jgi:hypothetical protein
MAREYPFIPVYTRCPHPGLPNAHADWERERKRAPLKMISEGTGRKRANIATQLEVFKGTLGIIVV